MYREFIFTDNGKRVEWVRENGLNYKHPALKGVLSAGKKQRKGKGQRKENRNTRRKKIVRR